MALMINGNCVNCTVCMPECPNEAISPGDGIFVIDPNKCTECIGHYDESQCIDICPVECIVVNPDRVESRGELQAKVDTIKAAAASKGT